MTISTCRGCGAPIRWVRTIHGGLMPLDAEPDPDGNVELVDHFAVVHSQPTLFGGDRWMPRHATCPDADQFRGPS